MMEPLLRDIVVWILGFAAVSVIYLIGALEVLRRLRKRRAKPAEAPAPSEPPSTAHR